MKLLVIEDENKIALPLKKYLENKGFAVDLSNNGADGLRQATINQYDCILLDLNLPKLDGMKLASKLRGRKNTVPIIMVTARSQIYDKIEGLDTGADDYVTKPFNLEELLARIKAVIKRNSINKIDKLSFANFELIPDKNQVRTRKNKKVLKISLSNKETAVLEYMLRNKGKIVSTEELLEHVWDSEIDMFTDTVKTHIKTLRQKLDPDKKMIKTIRGKGYIIE